MYNSYSTLLCYTIELPWLNNQRQISCIPEGSYELVKRYSPKFGWHLHLQGVKGRDMILIHPANNAIIELRGCIAPVSVHTAWGMGLASRRAMQILMEDFERSIREHQQHLVTIVSFE